MKIMNMWERSFPILDDSIKYLISNDAKLSERLDGAISIISSLSENDLPISCRKTFSELKAKFSNYKNSTEPQMMQSDIALAIFTFFKWYMVEAWPPTSNFK
jgi:hypothetical protein